ncbi:MAG: hypothetical protein KBS76_02190 [Ruminococcus sp.]|nr:hypothetical protein [Candidatus Apopatosoma intestinale]
MKRLFSVLVALLIVLTLVSCGEQKNPEIILLHEEFASAEEYIAFARGQGEKDVVLYVPANLPAAYTLWQIVYDRESGLTIVYSDGRQTATYRKLACDDPAAALAADYPSPDYTVNLIGEREYRYRFLQEETPDGFFVGYEVAYLCDGSLFTARLPAIASLDEVLSMAVLTQMIAFD